MSQLAARDMNDIQSRFNRFDMARPKAGRVRRAVDRVAPGIDAAAIFSGASSAGIQRDFFSRTARAAMVPNLSNCLGFFKP